ncbi:MAG: response regulator [Anaerolineae bacterium]
MKKQNHKQRIFIVEDDTDLSEMLVAYFRVQGYEVDNAVRGEDAVDAITAVPPDVVVLDIRLPDIDGYEVCRRIRGMRRTQNTPVIFLTEKRERQNKLTGLELGAVDYITKPFDIQELRLRIRNALRRANLTTFTNPVTGLAEGVVVKERIEEALRRPDWGVVLAGIRGLNKFRDKYGFVSADDVSRAVTLMIANTVQEIGSEDDFIGHMDTGDFVILTSADHSQMLAEQCLMRLRPSIQYFYPAIARQRLHLVPDSEKLTVQVSAASAQDHKNVKLPDLFAALAKQAL